MKTIDNPILINKFIEQFKIRDCFGTAEKIGFELVSFAKDEYLTREGAECMYLYFILIGRVKCYSCSRKRDSGIYVMNRGLVGDAEFISGNPSAETVSSLGETLCLRLKTGEYRHILMEDGIFLRFISQQLTSKIYMLENPSSNESIEMTSEERLYDYLKISSPDGRLITESLGDISTAMGFSYRHVIRMMNALCDEGKLRHGKRKGAYFLA